MTCHLTYGLLSHLSQKWCGPLQFETSTFSRFANNLGVSDPWPPYLTSYFALFYLFIFYDRLGVVYRSKVFMNPPTFGTEWRVRCVRMLKTILGKTSLTAFMLSKWHFLPRYWRWSGSSAVHVIYALIYLWSVSREKGPLSSGPFIPSSIVWMSGSPLSKIRGSVFLSREESRSRPDGFKIEGVLPRHISNPDIQMIQMTGWLDHLSSTFTDLDPPCPPCRVDRQNGTWS